MWTRINHPERSNEKTTQNTPKNKYARNILAGVTVNCLKLLFHQNISLADTSRALLVLSFYMQLIHDKHCSPHQQSTSLTNVNSSQLTCFGTHFSSPSLTYLKSSSPPCYESMKKPLPCNTAVYLLNKYYRGLKDCFSCKLGFGKTWIGLTYTLYFTHFE